MIMRTITIDDLITAGVPIEYWEDNEPTEPIKDNLKILLEKVVWPIETEFFTMEILRGYQSYKTASLSGGDLTSPHRRGLAVALYLRPIGMPIQKCVEKLVDFITREIPFDRLIINNTYVDVSYSRAHNRRIIEDNRQR